MAATTLPRNCTHHHKFYMIWFNRTSCPSVMTHWIHYSSLEIKKCVYATFSSLQPVSLIYQQLLSSLRLSAKPILLRLTGILRLYSSWPNDPCGWLNFLFPMFSIYWSTENSANATKYQYLWTDLPYFYKNSVTVKRDIATDTHTQHGQSKNHGWSINRRTYPYQRKWWVRQ